MNLRLPRPTAKASRDAAATIAISMLGLVTAAAVYATWRFAKLVP